METIDDTLRISMTGWREVTGPFHSLLGLRNALKGQYHTVVSRETVWVLVPGDRRQPRYPSTLNAPALMFPYPVRRHHKLTARCLDALRWAHDRDSG